MTKINKNLPRVLILYTGGTFGMDLTDQPQMKTVGLALPHLSPASLKKRIFDRVPELKELARCDVEILLNLDSSHIGPREWILMAKEIQNKWRSYDGIVLLHGTDTLAYTASALSFLLRPCLIPIVLTGAQRPLSALRTDARSNLISAVEIAAHGPREVVKQITVFFGESLYQGNRIRKISASNFAGFDSPHFPALAEVGTTIRYNRGLHGDQKGISRKKTSRLLPKFSERVLLIHVTPAFPGDCILDQAFHSSEGTGPGAKNSLDGIVLVVFHSWTAPTHDPRFLKFLKTAKARKIPIVIVTQDNTHFTREENEQAFPRLRYAAGKELISEGCFSGGSLTPECAFVKTSFLLGQSKDLKKFASAWGDNFACEGI